MRVPYKMFIVDVMNLSQLLMLFLCICSKLKEDKNGKVQMVRVVKLGSPSMRFGFVPASRHLCRHVGGGGGTHPV